MNILASFHFNDHQSPVPVYGEQIDHAPLARRELGHLTIDGRRIEGRIQLLHRGAHLRFEPGFGMPAVQRIGAVSGIGITHPGEPESQLLNLSEMRFTARNMLVIQPKEQIVARSAGEFQTSYGQCNRSAHVLAPLDARNGRDALHPLRQFRAAFGESLPPWIEARVEISIIRVIDRLFPAAGIVKEHLVARRAWIQALHAMAGGTLEAGGYEDRQSLDR